MRRGERQSVSAIFPRPYVPNTNALGLKTWIWSQSTFWFPAISSSSSDLTIEETVEEWQAVRYMGWMIGIGVYTRWPAEIGLALVIKS